MSPYTQRSYMHRLSGGHGSGILSMFVNACVPWLQVSVCVQLARLELAGDVGPKSRENQIMAAGLSHMCKQP